MCHCADDQCWFIGPIAPGMIDTLHYGCITCPKQDFVGVRDQVNLASRHDEAVQRVGAVHRRVTLHVYHGRRIFLLHLLVRIVELRRIPQRRSPEYLRHLLSAIWEISQAVAYQNLLLLVIDCAQLVDGSD